MAEATLAGALAARPRLGVGRPFVGPVFDVLVIGGGLSLLTVIGLRATGWLGDLPRGVIPMLVLLANAAHFAASTVRLYTKPGAFRDLPFYTMTLPAVTLAVLTLAIVFSDRVGQPLYVLYLTWSPYHYAAQTYGLAAMYGIRSGSRLDAGDQRLLWATCMLPFVYAFVKAPNSGLGWLIPPWVYVQQPWVDPLRVGIEHTVGAAVFIVPALLVARVFRPNGSGLPLVSWLLILTNGVWWVVFTYLDAFVWATVFHGIQYLAIVAVFHLRDHPPASPGRFTWVPAVLRFYLACLALGWVLFEVWPYAYVAAGFTLAQSMLLTTAVINIHHFIVDRGIWRVRQDANYRIVVGESGPAVA
jgi:hypothetical protein